MNNPELLVNITPNQKMYSFEGIDGSGKSTSIQLVNSELINLGYESTVVACPSGSIVGKFLRENLKKLEPWQRHSLFMMDMVDIINNEHERNPNSILLWDRYIDSNIVSNKDTSPEESAKWIACLPVPRKTFFYKIDPEIILRDRPQSMHDHSMDIKWQNLKHQRYLDLAKKNSNRIVTIDATEDRLVIAQKVTRIILDDLFSIKNMKNE